MNEDRMAGLEILEGYWYSLWRDLQGNTGRELSDSVSSLLSATVEIVIYELSYNNNQPLEYSRIGRDELRLYFVTLLAYSPKLKRYYEINDNENNREEETASNRWSPTAPPEISREFIFHLTKYMLGVVDILKKRIGSVIEFTKVRRIELLDSLLYLIDRYVHVELSVDERIPIREHLVDALSSEVERHLHQRFYRDHLLHVIDVFLLGHLLLKSRSNEDQSASLGVLFELLNINDVKKEEDWLREWAVAALLHDIGYQVNEHHRTIGERFSWQHFFKEELDDDESIRLRGAVRSEIAQYAENLVSEFRELSGYQADIADWFPRITRENSSDHGILSALRLLQIIIESARADKGNTSGLRDTALSLIERYDQALHAIAYHNLFSVRVKLSERPLACLLRICDELQEWGRRRINIEKMIRNLYINIEEGTDSQDTWGHESLLGLVTNLRFTKKEGNDEKSRLIVIVEKAEGYRFELEYRDSVKASYDPTTTMLSKAYNLQHIEWRWPDEIINGVEFWRIGLHFPIPEEYQGLSEYDLYALFNERKGKLPFMHTKARLEDLESGIGRFTDQGLLSDESSTRQADYDRFGIVIEGQVDSADHSRWLTRDPDELFNEFREFKKEMITARALGAIRRR